jgi:hypothetical protein
MVRNGSAYDIELLIHLSYFTFSLLRVLSCLYACSEIENEAFLVVFSCAVYFGVGGIGCIRQPT